MFPQLWETLKESITAYTGISPATFFTVVAVGLALYYIFSSLLSSSDNAHFQQTSDENMRPPVQLGEISEEDLKQYGGSDSEKPLLMAIKGQIYDVSQSRMFYGPGGPYALFAGKDASQALAKLSFDEKDLNGDLTGLGFFELEALQDWEYKFMTKYVKVGTVKKTVPASDGATKDQATGAAEHDAARSTEAANGDVRKPAEDGPSGSAAKEHVEI
ncbi:Membrane steroid-binding protein 2 [Abeliophyllum distichum]|uniref:Membrane steroid-binding protein 2 n=1 Tax=Abeliophyllum distichum TaxID=126358 RepID=A0ABD1VXK1_9LAMI